MVKEKSKKTFSSRFVLGLILLFIIVLYLVYNKNSSTRSEIDCLKLGSDKRAAECLRIIREKEALRADFPNSYLLVENVDAENNGYCIKVTGTVSNTYTVAAESVMLKISFSNTQNAEPFHYEVFSPYDLANEQIQPNDKKSFSTCLRNQSFKILNNINNWFFSIAPYSAKIHK